MINEITEKAYAKLNISLDVAGKRPDGFHNMKMIMQTISLHDEITITLNDTGTVCARMNLAYIPGDDRNLAVRAAKEYLSATGNEKYGAVISIRKNIPVGAGMAGGSANAAAVLRGLNRAFGNPIGSEELLRIAEKVGSDVPFCLTGGTALAEGRGEILTPVRDFPDCTFVVCKPNFSISTPELFRALDREKIRIHPDTAGILHALENADLRQISRRMYNVFEAVNDRRFRIVAEIKEKLLDAGAQGAVMTGTGSAVFGILEQESDTESLCRKLKNEYGFCKSAHPVGRLL